MHSDFSLNNYHRCFGLRYLEEDVDRSKYVSAQYVACLRYVLYLGLLLQNPGIVSGRTDLFSAVVSAVAVVTMALCLASVSDTTCMRKI